MYKHVYNKIFEIRKIDVKKFIFQHLKLMSVDDPLLFFFKKIIKKSDTL